MTDKLKAPELVEKAFVYITGLTRECRKALTVKFEGEHKGIPFDSVEAITKREFENWFARRDRNIKLNYNQTLMGRPGEIRVVYTGATRDVHFKIQIDELFTLADTSSKAPAYVKSLNVNVDKRDFTR